MNENDPIREYQMSMKTVIDAAERLRPIVRACHDAIERAGVKASVSVGKRDPSRPKVEIVFVCETLDETVPLLRELAKEGIRTDKADTHKDHNVFQIMAMREYNLGPQVTLVAILTSSMKQEGEGPRCRMEQVGVKEVPVFEMKCD